mmetsp:Transcript_127399/g.396563  ORF Transcript_127399/g.396563 Transcript_127399/m.396563 type:complete len:212 (-) Transcript_127399:27-662(-)
MQRRVRGVQPHRCPEALRRVADPALLLEGETELAPSMGISAAVALEEAPEAYLRLLKVVALQERVCEVKVDVGQVLVPAYRLEKEGGCLLPLLLLGKDGPEPIPSVCVVRVQGQGLAQVLCRSTQVLGFPQGLPHDAVSLGVLPVQAQHVPGRKFRVSRPCKLVGALFANPPLGDKHRADALRHFAHSVAVPAAEHDSIAMAQVGHALDQS